MLRVKHEHQPEALREFREERHSVAGISRRTRSFHAIFWLSWLRTCGPLREAEIMAQQEKRPPPEFEIFHSVCETI